jgi:hypothetical protein
VARRGLAIAVLVVLVIAAGIALWWLRPGSEPEEPPASFEGQPVAFSSPELGLEVVRLRAEAHESSTEWKCVLECLEPEGCHAEIRVVVRFLSAGEGRSLTFADTLDVARGSEHVVSGLQQPSLAVDRVESVEVVVERRLGGPGEPTPVPYF